MNAMNRAPVCIFGAGGLGRSVYALMAACRRADDVLAFAEDDEHFVARTVMGLEVRPLSDVLGKGYEFLVAVSRPVIRAEMMLRLGPEPRLAACVHPSAIFLDEARLGPGAIVFPNVYFSRNVDVGRGAVLMPGSIVGHDVVIGEGFVAAAQVNIAGRVRIGDRVSCGMSCCIRDGVRICDDAVIGMGAVVVRDVEFPGVYAGNPARRLRTR
jgi:sugar O-acyltransferase (sialic acid O-acetyltransferase NeuD family)